MTRFPLALVALAAALTGCGDDDAATEPPAPPAVTNSAPSTPASSPSAASPSASAAQSSGEGLDSVLADVRIAAPRLEGFFRGNEYPRELSGVVAALPKAGVELSPGNRLGSYRYDPDAVEFVLCVENSAGAFATYDTAPMATGAQGEDSGCPNL